MRSLDEFLDANGDKKHYGRIVEVKGLQSEVEFMSSPNQLFPFIMGPETIHHLKGRSAWEIFDFVGYRKHFVVQRLKSGSKFVLILFTGFQDEMKENVDSSNSDRTKPVTATWENVLTMVEKASQVVGERVRNVFSMIQTTPFYHYGVDFEQLDSDLLQQVNSFEAFEKSGHDSPAMVRAFLRHTMKLTELYAGDGYCYNDRGERGSKEYLMPRVAISQLVNRSDFFNLSDELNVAEL
jgi:hypothetical protein